MTRDWESTFSSWAQSPSKTEKERCERVIKAIGVAIKGSPKLQSRKILPFTQGSFRNRVNVRQDSDVDVGVMLYDYFLDQYPEGKTRADFGFSAADYPFAQFKNELEEALVAHFGRATVTRGNKAFDIKATAPQVGADVVPLFALRVQAILGQWGLPRRRGAHPGQQLPPDRELPRTPGRLLAANAAPLREWSLEEHGDQPTLQGPRTHPQEAA